MNSKSFDELKREVLPLDLQDHFVKNREIFNRNIEKYENLMNAIQKSNISLEQKAIFDLILDSLQNSQRTESVLLDHNEMAYFSCFLLRNQIEHIDNTFKNHGIIIERLTGYEKGLRFVDDYIKHHSDGNEI